MVKEYLKQLELLAPNYLSEEYIVQIQIENSIFQSKLHVMPFHKDQPGLRLYSEKQKEVIISQRDPVFMFSTGKFEFRARKSGISLCFGRNVLNS